jgi:hypothetical protein
MMTRTPNKNLPPIIEGWIHSLHDPKIEQGIRENYLYMLENVRAQCTNAIQAYNLEKYSVPLKKKKRA